MTDQPSEAALRKACEVLGITGVYTSSDTVNNLARHFDAEDKAARDALSFVCRPEKTVVLSVLTDFTRRHILPDPKPTVADVVETWRLIPGRPSDRLADMLRDAGLLREDG